MDSKNSKGLAVLLGFPSPTEPKPNARKAAIQRLKEAFKSDDDDAIEEALKDYNDMMAMENE